MRTYQKLLDMGIARELARIGPSPSLYTNGTGRIDLHNRFHSATRLDEHAQYEIASTPDHSRDIRKVSHTTEAFEEHKGEQKPSVPRTCRPQAVLQARRIP